MHVDLVWLTATLLSFPLLTLCDPLHIMLAPQILRVGTTERVFVQVLDYNGQNPLPVQITVKNFPSKETDLFEYKVTLNSTNAFQSLVDVQIPYLEDHFNSDSKEKQFVYLRASFPHSYVEKLVMVSFQSGYIFLQTDKTIYTPDSTVKYRVFALNTGVMPLHEPIVVKIMSPDGITIFQKIQYGNIKVEEYKLGSPISYGIWKIAASFTNNPRKDFTVKFEVKEYVLPSFEVKLTPAESFYYIDDEEFAVEISARYLFGRDVNGSAFVVFGVFSEGKKISIQSSLQRVQIYNGKGTANVTCDQILETFPKQAELIGKTLYISVRVLTETGSEIVEAEKRGIYIVESPYVIKFTRTPKFFKPGFPFNLMVYVTNPDGTPAKGVLMSVTPTNTKGVTNQNGLAQFIINTEKTRKSLEITVRTEAVKLPEERQAKKHLTVQAYTSNSSNYLHIDIPNRELKVRESVIVELHFLASSEVKQVITILVLSKGRIVHALRKQRDEFDMLLMMMPITKEMVPSFRVVAYYHVGSSEVVADSVWVDVKDTCMGTLQVTQHCTDALKPNDELRLVIKGNAGANVSLVAVDKGIYVLNNRSRLTQAKIWDIVEKHDIACTAGSGKDSMGVFYNAGLLFASNSAGSTNDRRDFSCPSQPTRRRRELTVAQLGRTIVDTSNQTPRQCCADGMVENLLGYTCERRAEYVEDGVECREAFLHCCQKLDKLKAVDMMQEELLSNDEFELDPDDHSDYQSRSVFHDSWMMEDIKFPDCEVNETCIDMSYLQPYDLPGSITTWMISAISMSEDYGICVADPYEVKVTKNLFIELRLPYTAVVNEQIEIKAVIHNLSNKQLEMVHVMLKDTETICDLANYERQCQMGVQIDSKSSQAVSFVIVPLSVGELDIGVYAFASGERDAVVKKLKVVIQGVPTSTGETTLILEPKHGRDQPTVIKRPLLKNQMPGTEAHTYIAVTGQPLAWLINHALSGKGLDKLITQPSGSGEQNLLRMVLPLIATYYLDKTNKWNDVGVDQRTKALSYIYTGYISELAYRKPDHSFGNFKSTPGNTWLTAYVVRMFSMASDVVTINVDLICNAIKWLILEAQMPNGVFREVYYVSSYAMGGKYSEFTMTAYVLIALQEGKRICKESVTSLEDSMDMAVKYIGSNIDYTSDPYAVAMASYALANEGKLKDSVLLQFTSEDGSHWPVKNSHLSTLEATGYALLSLVTAGEFSRTLSIVKWLKSNQRFQGGYESTQTTAVVFEALAKYTAAKPPTFEGEIQVTIQSTLRKTPVKVLFTKSDRGLERSETFKAGGDLVVTASGHGEVTIRVVTLYYTKPDNNTTTCSNFELDVKMTRDAACKEVPNCYKLTVDIKFLDKERDATMTILDVGMLTGFVPDMTDLKKLKGKDKYIEEFEMDSQLSERGSLIIYLKKVSHRDKETIAFRVHQMLITDLPQPAAVSVYEYYTSENRCTRFYDASTERSSGLPYTLCPTDVCTCAEKICPRLKTNDPDKNNRSDEACSHKDYVYKGTLKEVKRSGNVDIYTFSIVSVLKHGIDQNVTNQMRDFLSHYCCRSKIGWVKDKSYLLMGPEPQKVGSSYDYMLGVRSWIEYWPTFEESQKDQRAHLTYTDLAAFSRFFLERRCMI